MEINTTVILGLGSNLGERLDILRTACERLTKEVGKIIDSSRVYESKSWGFESADYFLNACVVLETAYSPQQVLHKIHLIECELGRERVKESTRYTSRTIDIDILYFGDQQINLPNLIIPHPEIANRKFVLYPLSDLNETFFQSISYQSIEEMIRACFDEIEPISIHETRLQPF